PPTRRAARARLQPRRARHDGHAHPALARHDRLRRPRSVGHRRTAARPPPHKTVVCGEEKRAGVYKGIEREVRAGRQAYVVYPLVEESEKMDLKDATRMYEHLRDRVFPHFSIGLVHGKMKPAEKGAVMRLFVGGETQ